MAARWLGISSANAEEHCGDYSTYYHTEALDGVDYWRCQTEHEHYFIVDLKKSYLVTKIRGRSCLTYDPTLVDIYVSDNKEDFGDPVAEDIHNWQSTLEWAETETIEKSGRYVKAIIKTTEEPSYYLYFGASPPMTIFDVYGDPGLRPSLISPYWSW